MANYRGAENVEFIWNGTQSDPSLVYDGKTFNYYDIDNALWYMFYEDNKFIEEGTTNYEGQFDEYVQEHVEDYLQDVIFGGYFE